jgi:hypothetical protein
MMKRVKKGTRGQTDLLLLIIEQIVYEDKTLGKTTAYE